MLDGCVCDVGVHVFFVVSSGMGGSVQYVFLVSL